MPALSFSIEDTNIPKYIRKGINYTGLVSITKIRKVKKNKLCEKLKHHMLV